MRNNHLRLRGKEIQITLDIVSQRTIRLSLEPGIEPPREENLVDHLDDEAESKKKRSYELQGLSLPCSMHKQIVARLA